MTLEVRRSGEERESREEGEPVGKYHWVERSFGSFRRPFTLPRTVRADGITADFENARWCPAASRPVHLLWNRPRRRWREPPPFGGLGLRRLGGRDHKIEPTPQNCGTTYQSIPRAAMPSVSGSRSTRATSRLSSRS